MSRNKTRDGLSLGKIVKMLGQLAGVEIREGTKHPYIANYDGLRPCPVAASTDAKRMLVPWLKKATGYKPNYIYSSLKTGRW